MDQEKREVKRSRPEEGQELEERQEPVSLDIDLEKNKNDDKDTKVTDETTMEVSEDEPGDEDVSDEDSLDDLDTGSEGDQTYADLSLHYRRDGKRSTTFTERFSSLITDFTRPVKKTSAKRPLDSETIVKLVHKTLATSLGLCTEPTKDPNKYIVSLKQKPFTLLTDKERQKASDEIREFEKSVTYPSKVTYPFKATKVQDSLKKYQDKSTESTSPSHLEPSLSRSDTGVQERKPSSYASSLKEFFELLTKNEIETVETLCKLLLIESTLGKSKLSIEKTISVSKTSTQTQSTAQEVIESSKQSTTISVTTAETYHIFPQTTSTQTAAQEEHSTQSTTSSDYTAKKSQLSLPLSGTSISKSPEKRKHPRSPKVWSSKTPRVSTLVSPSTSKSPGVSTLVSPSSSKSPVRSIETSFVGLPGTKKSYRHVESKATKSVTKPAKKQ